MSVELTVGFLVLKVPVMIVETGATLEDPSEQYPALGKARLIGYELSDYHLEWLGHDAASLMDNFELPTERISALAEGATERRGHLFLDTLIGLGGLNDDTEPRLAVCSYSDRQTGKHPTWKPGNDTPQDSHDSTRWPKGLPFFESKPDRKFDLYYCGCWGWD